MGYSNLHNMENLYYGKKIIFIVLITFLFGCAKEGIKSENHADCMSLQEQEVCTPFYFQDTYDFPIVPGTEEWKLLNSLDKKVNACQIPNDILTGICTHALIETTLNYPLILDYGAFNSMQSGFERIKTENNGFVELFRRNDLYSALIERYELLSFECKTNIYPPYIMGDAAPLGIAIQTFELFLFQDEVISNISEEDIKLLFSLVYEKHLMKTQPKFSDYDKIASAGILGKIMYSMDYTTFVEKCNEDDKLKSFIEYLPSASSSALIETITDFAMDYADTIS